MTLMKLHTVLSVLMVLNIGRKAWPCLYQIYKDTHLTLICFVLACGRLLELILVSDQL